MSVRMEYLLLSPTTRPIAIPAQGDLSGTPASIMAREPPQTVAIEEEPLDSRMSLTRRIAYGNSVSGGSRLVKARSARAPWPISLRPGPRFGFTSPTLKDGKL